MQAWQQVKVINKDSEYSGRAGAVKRVERKGDEELVFVSLDAENNEDGTVKNEEVQTQFAPDELQILGG